MSELPSYTAFHKYLDDPRRVFPAWVSPQGEWLTCAKGEGYDLHEFAAMEISGITKGKEDIRDDVWSAQIEALAFMYSHGYARVGFDHQDPSTEEIIVSVGKSGLSSAQASALRQKHVVVPSSEEWEPAREFDRTRYGKEKTAVQKLDRALMGMFLPAEFEYAQCQAATRKRYKKAVDIGAVCSK